MKNLKPLLLSLTIGLGIIASPAQAQGAFNSKIANPFVFCKLPKPCKACQPFRKIHEELCKAGQPTAEAKKMHQDAVNQGYGNNSASADELKSQFTPAISSAYEETPQESEVGKYISWLSTQPGPKNGSGVFQTMADYWKAKGITNFYNDPTIVNTATQVIKDRNQQIVASVSAGSIPTNPKPWLEQRASVSTQPDISLHPTPYKQQLQ